MRTLHQLYGSQPAATFGPLALATVRRAMIENGATRSHINKQVVQIRHVFKWAASREMVPASVVVALQTLPGLLQRDRSDAHETDPVRPVPDADVEVVKPYVSRQVRALIELQLLTAGRDDWPEADGSRSI